MVDEFVCVCVCDLCLYWFVWCVSWFDALVLTFIACANIHFTPCYHS